MIIYLALQVQGIQIHFGFCYKRYVAEWFRCRYFFRNGSNNIAVPFSLFSIIKPKIRLKIYSKKITRLVGQQSRINDTLTCDHVSMPYSPCGMAGSRQVYNILQYFNNHGVNCGRGAGYTTLLYKIIFGYWLRFQVKNSR